MTATGAKPDRYSRRRRRRWRIGSAVFDESSWSMTVDGVSVAIESKPLEVLHELCIHAGEVVAKDELLEWVWGDVHVVEASVPTAVAKLRRALGDGNGKAIVTVAGIGYRLAGPVSVETLTAPLAPRFRFAPGDAVPGRPQWLLLDPLGDHGAEDVWRARNVKTGERRVFKFADAPDRLRALKREVAIVRLLTAALGPDGPFVGPLEWNFATAPYFIESRDAGISLVDWARAAGGLGAIPLDQRLVVAARCAHALAAVHGVGVLHKDVKPANILVETVDGRLRVRLADFGSGRIADDALTAYDITDLGMDSPSEQDRLSGTPFYCAPELNLGAVPTVRSDVYALGLVLFQLAVGDFGRVPAPGWEREIDDPVLRGDIAEAAAGDPDARTESAAALAARLEQLSARRARAAADAVAARQLETLNQAEARRSARKPWIRAAGVSAALGIIGISAASIVAVNQRDEARRQARVVQASYDFLANDLLARADPYRSGVSNETVEAAARRASLEIERRFAEAPAIAAGLHHTLARAFDQRSDLAAARHEYSEAARQYRSAGQLGRRDRALAITQWAQLEALSGDPSRLPIARRLLTEARDLMPEQGVVAVWLASADGSVALAEERVQEAQTAFRRSSILAERLPADFDARQRLNLRQRVAFTHLRLGDGVEAEALLRPLAIGFARLDGPDHPNTLIIRLNLVQSLLVQKRYEDVIAQASALLPLMERSLGETNRRTLQVVAVRQQALGSVGRYAEAAKDGDRVWRTTARQEGAGTFQAVAGRADTGETQCRAGLYQAGIENARAALATAHASPGPETALAMAIRTTVAGCLIGAGRALEAAPLLERIDTKKVSELAGDQKWGANLDLARAQVAVAQGSSDQARLYLANAVRLLDDQADQHQTAIIDRLKNALGRMPCGRSVPAGSQPCL